MNATPMYWDMANAGAYLGESIIALLDNQSVWSQKTFGSDQRRGPVGALKHLKKEAQECIDNPRDLTELADCQLLIMDANRRSGFTFPALIAECHRKLEINKLRKWPAPSDDDEPVCHVAVKPEFKSFPDKPGVWIQYVHGKPWTVCDVDNPLKPPAPIPGGSIYRYYGPIPAEAE